MASYSRSMVIALATQDVKEVKESLVKIFSVRDDLHKMAFDDTLDLTCRLASAAIFLSEEGTFEAIQAMDYVRSIFVTILSTSNGALSRTTPSGLEAILNAVIVISKSQHSIVEHMTALYFTGLCIFLECYQLPTSDPLREKLASFIENFPGHPEKKWSINDESDVALAHTANSYMSTTPLAKTPLEAEIQKLFYGFLCFFGLVLCVISSFYTEYIHIQTPTLVVGTAALLFGFHKMSRIWHLTSKRNGLLLKCSERCESLWCGEWQPLQSQTQKSNTTLCLPEEKSQEVESIGTSSQHLYSISEENGTEEGSNTQRVDEGILNQIDPNDLYETLSKLQGILDAADSDDVSQATRERVRKSLDLLTSVNNASSNDK